MNVRSTVLVGAALAATGCGFGSARNAFLELEIEIPRNDRQKEIGERYAQIRVASVDTPFEQEWQGENPVPSVKLSELGVGTQRISVEATDSSETKPVRVKVRFCKSPACTELDDDSAPEAWLELERAFYLGERTRFTWRIPCIPSPVDPSRCGLPHKVVQPVPKCLVGGCRSGFTTNYCVGNKHFCEE